MRSVAVAAPEPLQGSRIGRENAASQRQAARLQPPVRLHHPLEEPNAWLIPLLDHGVDAGAPSGGEIDRRSLRMDANAHVHHAPRADCCQCALNDAAPTGLERPEDREQDDSSAHRECGMADALLLAQRASAPLRRSESVSPHQLRD